MKINMGDFLKNINILNKNLKFYSQNGEDFLLWKFFNYKKEGFFIDVGAFDGKYLSNSFSFEQAGWKGICVEPNPEIYELLENNRIHSKNINSACLDNNSIKSIMLKSESWGYLSTINNSEEKELDIKQRYKKRGFEFKGFKKINVPATTLNNIIEKYAINKEIDFISIDVEDAELLVLNGLDLKTVKPKVVILESNTKKSEIEIKDYMTKNNYHYAGRLIQNIFFVREAQDIQKITSIEINCKIEKQTHPLNEKYSIKAYLDGKIINSKTNNKHVLSGMGK